MADIKPGMPATMTEASGAERRRTQRVQISMPVIVRAKEGKGAFEEKTQTISVNANGCLVKLALR